MKLPRGSYPIACHVGPLFAITATRFERNHDQDHRSQILGAFGMRAGSRQTSSDMSLYIMFAGKVALLALALARLG